MLLRVTVCFVAFLVVASFQGGECRKLHGDELVAVSLVLVREPRQDPDIVFFPHSLPLHTQHIQRWLKFHTLSYEEQEAIAAYGHNQYSETDLRPHREDFVSIIEVGAPDTPMRTEEEHKIVEPTPWCRKVMNVWLSKCVFVGDGGQADEQSRRKCKRILNTWMQKCVSGSESSKRHAEDVDQENSSKKK